MQRMQKRNDLPAARRGIGLGSVVLGAALVGSVFVLAGLSRRPSWRAASGAREPRRPDPEPRTREEEREIPILHDVVDAEELRRAPVEPPVLTDEVVPGRGRR